MHTGLRYANLYCAMCHNVTNFRFWRVDVGCIQVANDECRFPLDINLDKEFYNLIDMLRNDPSVEQLNIPSCYVKQYLPPDGFAEVRRCQIDSSEYISTCPESTQNWKILSCALILPHPLSMKEAA
ncbi:hypothetical protein EB796_024466 [Bugula neritina]|uniref:Uncharacterized protein n=1 Tax=Bugula neritina TaxID=10212 RepID=A0A7J7ITU4_BUGNE|nr:hypothetical protein EB796_024466 [Bugula neritina]